MIRQGDRGSRIRCFELLIALAFCLQGVAGQHQSSVLNDTEEVFSDGNETFEDALESFTATTTFTTRTRTTTRTLAPESSWDNLTGTSTSATATTTMVFSCPLPTDAWGSDLINYASCIKRRCEEMHSDVMHNATAGRITNCFLLLEAAGGCQSDATAEVAELSQAHERFEVGDLCGPFCPTSHCERSTSSPSRVSNSRPVVPMPTTTTGDTGIIQEPVGVGGQTTTEPPLSTASATTSLDLLGSASRLRVLISCLTFRISAPKTFGAQTGILKALRDGIAASLAVSPAQVNILSVNVPSDSPGKANSEERKAGLGRRLQMAQAPGDVRVPFEVMRAPSFLDAQLFGDPATATAMEVHLSQLFVAAGVVGTISDLRLKEPEIVFREVTKKETSVNEWFFTYPVDTKMDYLEPTEPGLASGGGAGAIFAWSAGVLLCLVYFL